MENQGKENEKESQKKKKKSVFEIIKIIWNIIEKILMIALVFISLVIVTQRVSNNEKTFLGFRMFKVETGSMTPKYLVGDVILIREKDINKIAVGEDVTYIGAHGVMKGQFVTHRVVGIEEVDGERVFRTKGIANLSEDPLIHPKQINGVVIGKLPIVTYICSLLTNRYIFYFLGVIPLTILIFFTVLKRNVKKYDEMSKKN